MKRVRWPAAGLGVVAAFCAGAGDVSFKADVVPLIKSRCVVCHVPGGAQAGLVLHPNGGYANLIGVPSAQSPLLLVKAGDAQGSYFYRKLTGTHREAGGSGERMPFAEAALGDAQLELIRRWIDNGAHDD